MKVKHLSCFTRDSSLCIFKADPTVGGGREGGDGLLVTEDEGLKG